MRSNNSFLTLIASFCLSAVAYNVAQPVKIPVQHIEFDDYVIQPRVEVIEFEEYVIIAQADEVDDGDGENIDMMNANWCLIHPDDVICQGADVEDEEEGC